MSHVHTFFIHMFFSYLLWTCVSFYSFLRSLLNRTSLWHPNRRNPLRLGTFIMVLSHPFLLFLLFHLTSDSVMKRPRRTSLRTSKAVVFIRNTRLLVRFCQHSSTRSHSNLRLWISTWETHEVSYHVYLGVLLQHTWHRYCCALVCYCIQRYTYCSYSASYIRGTTCP